MGAGDPQPPPAPGWDQRDPKDEDREPQDITNPRMGSEEPTTLAVPGWDQRDPKDEDKRPSSHHQPPKMGPEDSRALPGWDQWTPEQLQTLGWG